MLSGLIAKISKNYFDRRNGAKIDPLLSYDAVISANTLKEMMEEDDFSLVSEGGDDIDVEGVMIEEELKKTENAKTE